MYAIRKSILEQFSAFTNPSFGAIKPALVRLEKKECLNLRKIISDGGKVSIFYELKNEGKKELKKQILSPLSQNPIQFFSDARLKLACSDILSAEESAELYLDIKTNALLHRINAERILNDDYTSKTYLQKLVLDNVICEYNNIISLIEGLEKNASNS